MKDEITAAAFFITQMIKVQNPTIKKEQVEQFQYNLTSSLLERFKNHWYQNAPTKGQGYRCIRVNDTEPVDPVLQSAAKDSGIEYHYLRLPSELTLWVDPTEVSCRLGEVRGSYCTVALFREGSSENKAKSYDMEKILAQHLENKQAQHVKFVQATSTRWNQKDPASRCSPPIHFDGYNTNLPHTDQYYDDQGSGYQNSNGYQNSQWGSWNVQDSRRRLSPPNDNFSSPKRHPHHSRNRHAHNHGNSHAARQSTFSNHPSDRFHWKGDDAVKA